MKEQLEAILQTATQAIRDSGAATDLEALRVKYLGKKGELTAVLKQMGKLAADQRPAMGKMANEVRAKLETALTEQAAVLAEKAMEARLTLETVDVTIPEGFTMQDIFRRLEENKVATYDAFLKAAAEYNFKYDFVESSSYAGAARLEGYLFPDTYQFYVNMEASSAINKLLNNFYLKYNADMLSQTEKMGITVKDVVSVASIIEKEAKLDEDRPLVASVIYNRLVSGMSLGMDSTILYLYQDHNREPTAEMLADNSPYNTHLNPGLPPTPICNPGLASINAALNPSESNYYYFYADPESDKLNFFTTYEEFANYANTHPHTAS